MTRFSQHELLQSDKLTISFSRETNPYSKEIHQKKKFIKKNSNNTRVGVCEIELELEGNFGES